MLLRKKSILSLGLIAFIMLAMTFGCGVSKQIKENPAKGAYYVALASYNDALESYLGQKDGLASETRKEIEPVFEEAGKALDAWGAVHDLENSDAYEKQAAYNKVKSELFRLLFEYGILQLRE